MYCARCVLPERVVLAAQLQSRQMVTGASVDDEKRVAVVLVSYEAYLLFGGHALSAHHVKLVDACSAGMLELHNYVRQLQDYPMLDTCFSRRQS